MAPEGRTIDEELANFWVADQPSDLRIGDQKSYTVVC